MYIMLKREYYARVENGTIRDTLISMDIENANSTSQINNLMNYRKVCFHSLILTIIAVTDYF